MLSLPAIILAQNYRALELEKNLEAAHRETEGNQQLTTESEHPGSKLNIFYNQQECAFLPSLLVLH